MINLVDNVVVDLVNLVNLVDEVVDNTVEDLANNCLEELVQDRTLEDNEGTSEEIESLGLELGREEVAINDVARL